MTLDWYLMRRFLMSFVTMLAAVTLFVTLIDIVEQMRRFAQADVVHILERVALQLPSNLSLFFPLIMLLSAIGFATSLSRSSEFVVAQAYGRSIARNLLGPIFVMLLIGGLVVAVLNPLVARSQSQLSVLDQGQGQSEGSVLSIGDNGVWVRLREGDGFIILRADRVNGQTLNFIGVTVLRYDAKGLPLERIVAPRARLTGDGQWRLPNAQIWRLDHDQLSTEPQIETILTLDTQINQSDLWEDLSSPSMISIWKLPSFITTLQNSGFDTAKHDAWRLKELARPLFLVALGVIGIVLGLHHFRASGQARAIVVAVALAFGLHYMRDFSLILAENGQITPLIGALSPIVAAGFLVATLLVTKDAHP